MQRNNTAGTSAASAGSLYSVGCELQEERNLGVETSVIRQRSVEEIEGEEHGNGFAIGAVCAFIIGLVAIGVIAAGVAFIHWVV